MRIKEVAELAGVSVRSVRYYDSAGLLSSTRAANGYRDFPVSAVVRARNIKALVDIGLTLDDVRQFGCCLDGDVTTARPAEAKVRLAAARLRELQRRRDEVTAACSRLEAALELIGHSPASQDRPRDGGRG